MAKNKLSDRPSEDDSSREELSDSENDIAHDKRSTQNRSTSKRRFSFLRLNGKKSTENIVKRNPLSILAYNLLSARLPTIPQYRETYEQAGMPLVYEAYLSTGFLVAFIIMIPTFVLSFIVETRLFSSSKILEEVLGSAVLCAVVLATTILLWLVYPILRRRSFKTALENQLAYSFGILGVLAAAGMTLDRLFERIATSESNPVLSELAKRFLRNVRLFGLDSETSLKEVALHSPSGLFSSMLDSISVAYKTTGSIHDLIMFESARLLHDKGENLKRAISSLSVMAELYITLVVVGPIIFIVMLSIFGLLPAGGLPNPVLLIDLIVFVGIPLLSVFFILLLDSVIGRA